ncbi:hypothetical protein TetV_017 [Tetraselmis virus 1]|uniref:Uncharacterized protein n=1 Tax=Tetraselmis virus 1 TaxID=2060617 RepID=A0A2P0VN04_9VIRU|nr:hypothetical protein QJ968_gp017 [Tetraselmis virus 1]AUF82109.1 hypothetical protein TetV_017 [Tetraselmis virus 1]
MYSIVTIDSSSVVVKKQDLFNADQNYIKLKHNYRCLQTKNLVLRQEMVKMNSEILSLKKDNSNMKKDLSLIKPHPREISNKEVNELLTQLKEDKIKLQEKYDTLMAENEFIIRNIKKEVTDLKQIIIENTRQKN